MWSTAQQINKNIQNDGFWDGNDIIICLFWNEFSQVEKAAGSRPRCLIAWLWNDVKLSLIGSLSSSPSLKRRVIHSARRWRQHFHHGAACWSTRAPTQQLDKGQSMTPQFNHDTVDSVPHLIHKRSCLPPLRLPSSSSLHQGTRIYSHTCWSESRSCEQVMRYTWLCVREADVKKKKEEGKG